MPLPGVESDYRVALRLGMTIRQFQTETLCSEYVYWIALLNDIQDRRDREEREARRGR